jgi:hypothetical protein
MLEERFIDELRSSWFPNLTDKGLNQWIRLIEKDSPMLIQRGFSIAGAMGCLASHAAWHHPATSHLESDAAGSDWLLNVVGIHHSASAVISKWDRDFDLDGENRSQFVRLLRDERQRRTTGSSEIAAEPQEDAVTPDFDVCGDRQFKFERRAPKCETSNNF